MDFGRCVPADFPSFRLQVELSARFAWTGDEMVGEYDAGGLLVRRFVPGAGADEPVVSYEGTSTTDRRWLLADQLGSVIAHTGATGSASVINSYDEYGLRGPANAGRFQFTGQMLLPELGFYHYKARVFAPVVGRFLQTDPIGYADGMNLYAYVGGDPTNHIDPVGLERTTVRQRECTSPGPIGGSDYVADGDCYYSYVTLTSPFQRRVNTFAGGAGATADAPPAVSMEIEQLAYEQIDRCLADSLGISTLLGAGAVAAGQPVEGTKRFITKGSSRGTSYAGKASMKIFGRTRMPTSLPMFVGGPGTGTKLRIASTPLLGRFVGRAVSILGWGILAGDAVQFVACASQ